MPAVCAHYIFARELVPELLKIDVIEDLDSTALYLGAQGPDFLYFSRRAPWMVGKRLHKLGSRLHKINPDLIFDSMRRYVKLFVKNDAERDTALSYIYGFLCHYALDRAAHPYVLSAMDRIYEEEKITYDKRILHSRIETNLDTILLIKKLNIHGWEYEPQNCYPIDSESNKVISDMMSYVIEIALHESVTPKEIIRSFSDTRKINKYMYDKNGKKKEFVKKTEKIIGQGPFISSLMRDWDEDRLYDYENKDRIPWKNGLGEESVLTFGEVFENAKKDALVMVLAFSKSLKDGRTMREITGGLSFANGGRV